MNDEVFLRELRLNGKPLEECKVALDCNRGNYRLYVDMGVGAFWTSAVEFHSCSTEFENPWDDPDVMVTTLFNTTAYFDGVRHLEFKAGINYPNIQGLIDLMRKVRELELGICERCDRYGCGAA